MDAFRASEAELRLVMDNVPAMIAYLDQDLRYRVVNRQYAAMLGEDSDELIGRTPADFLDPRTYARARPLMDRALAGENVKFEREILFKDGRQIWVSVTFAPDIRKEAGKSSREVKGFYSLIVDIDERKRAEEAQALSEQRFRDIVSASSDWFWEMDARDRVSYLSERAADLGGIDVARMLGKAPSDMQDPEGQDSLWLQCRSMIEARAAFRDVRCRYRGGADGKLRQVIVSGIPLFDAAGCFTGYRGSVNDVTSELEALEERERIQNFFITALEILNVNCALYDPNGITTYVNENYKRFMKGAGLNNGPGDSFEDLLNEIIRRGAVEAAKGREQAWIDERVQSFHALRIGETERKFRSKFRWLDGSEHWADTIRTRTPDGYILSATIDVTEQVMRGEELRQAQKMEAVGQLTGGIAHDFNNILAVVLGNLDLMSDHVGNHPEFAELLFKAIRAAERGAELTQRLLAFSRKQPLMPRPTDINVLVRGIEELLRGALGGQNELEFVRAAGLWRCAVDPSQVENAILNLAINARDSMPGGGKLTIETANARLDDEYAAAQAELEPGQYVMLAVTDTGSGMSPETRARIFEPFFTTKEAGQGSGLGLSMVYGFVKQSRGHISVYSELGEGTTIKIYLPRATARDEMVTQDSSRPGKLSGQGQRVLVVEDEQLVREMTRDLLIDLGYEVLMAESGSAALDVIADGREVDLLLTDAVLPGGMNGRELSDAVRKLRPGMRVLYMSGYTENAIIHHGRLDRDAVLLQKPFRKKDLALKMREALTQQVPDGKAKNWGET